MTNLKELKVASYFSVFDCITLNQQDNNDELFIVTFTNKNYFLIHLNGVVIEEQSQMLICTTAYSNLNNILVCLECLRLENYLKNEYRRYVDYTSNCIFEHYMKN